MKDQSLSLFVKVGRRYVPAPQDAVMETATAYLREQTLKVGMTLSSPRDTRQYLQFRAAGLGHEVFGVVFLDNRHRVIGEAELFRGTIDGSSVYPREVVKETLARNAAAVIFWHNHPSGNTEPSQADGLITVRLRDALALVDVRVLDHLIVAGQSCTSLAERGLL